MPHSRRHTLRLALAAVILALIGLYAYTQASDLIRGPVLELNTPHDMAHLTEPVVIVEGTTRNVSRITLNEHPIFITPEGEFRETLPLTGRYTIMQITVEDRFGRSDTTERALWYASEFPPLPSREEIEARRAEELVPPGTEEDTAATEELL